MSEHAYSFYCKHEYWQRCSDKDLEVVKVLDENYDEDGNLLRKEGVYRCRRCGGFYKQRYRATYYPSHLFDTEEGWDISDKYFRIEEPVWKTPGSTLDVPLTISEARSFGYTGEDHTWKNGRCNFPAQNQELTCRAGDLQFIADATPNAWDHLRNKLYKCRRCGEWFLFTPLPPHPQGFFKPSNELFPLDLARAYGYEENSSIKSEPPPADFGALARRAIGSNAPEDWNALCRALFALPEWIFIARGTVPNLYPYSAPPAAGGEPLVRGFTDRERAQRFVRENGLTESDGSCVTLHIPTADVAKHLENYPVPGIRGVWFNSGSGDAGFVILLERLRPLTEYFLNAGSDQKQTVKTLRVTVQEALVLSPEIVRETPYKINFFCRVPADWLENDQLKPQFWKKIADQIFGEDWSAETLPVGHYIIKSSETVIFDDRRVKDQNWRDFVETDDNLYYFFIGSENGEARKVTAEEFQENVDAFFKKTEDAAARSEPSDISPDIRDEYEPENLNELDASLTEAWREPEKLPAASLWFNPDRNETAQAQYGYIILKKHLARENLKLRPAKLPGSFWSLGWALYLNTDALMRETKHAGMLKTMFTELVDFCRIVSGEYFAFRLKELLQTLLDGGAARDRLMPLLPEKARNQFTEIERMLDEEYEADIERQNQMGY